MKLRSPSVAHAGPGIFSSARLGDADERGAVRALVVERVRVGQGRADPWISLRAWIPATLHRPCAVVELDARLLGLRLTAKLVLDRLTRANFERVARASVAMPAVDRPTGDDWRRLEPARLATSIATTRRDVMLALAKHWVVVCVLRDNAGPRSVGAVLDTLGIPADTYEILEPIVRDLPADMVAQWRSFRADGVWQQRIGNVIAACSTISTVGGLAVLNDRELGLEHAF